MARRRAYVLGAPEFVLGRRAMPPTGPWQRRPCADGQPGASPGRTAARAPTAGALPDAPIPWPSCCCANPVRENAKETFAYFQDQGVTIKVISGDNPVTVAAVAARGRD